MMIDCNTSIIEGCKEKNNKMPISLDEFKKLAPKGEKSVSVPTDKLLAELKKTAMTTKEVAKLLGVQSGTAYSRLQKLEKIKAITRGMNGTTSYWAANLSYVPAPEKPKVK